MRRLNRGLLFWMLVIGIVSGLEEQIKLALVGSSVVGMFLEHWMFGSDPA